MSGVKSFSGSGLRVGNLVFKAWGLVVKVWGLEVRV